MVKLKKCKIPANQWMYDNLIELASVQKAGGLTNQTYTTRKAADSVAAYPIEIKFDKAKELSGIGKYLHGQINKWWRKREQNGEVEVTNEKEEDGDKKKKKDDGDDSEKIYKPRVLKPAWFALIAVWILSGKGQNKKPLLYKEVCDEVARLLSICNLGDCEKFDAMAALKDALVKKQVVNMQGREHFILTEKGEKSAIESVSSAQGKAYFSRIDPYYKAPASEKTSTTTNNNNNSSHKRKREESEREVVLDPDLQQHFHSLPPEVFTIEKEEMENFQKRRRILIHEKDIDTMSIKEIKDELTLRNIEVSRHVIEKSELVSLLDKARTSILEESKDNNLKSHKPIDAMSVDEIQTELASRYIELPSRKPKAEELISLLRKARKNEPKIQDIIQKPEEWSIILLTDNREVTNCADLVSELGSDVANRSEGLSIGDFVWIAKHKDTGEEIMCSFLIERKTVNDLLGSIRVDSRYVEQKMRMNEARDDGIRQLIYLVEGESRDLSETNRRGGGEQSMRTAISETMIHHGYIVKETRNKSDTIKYLKELTLKIQILFHTNPRKALPNEVISFRAFQAKYKKNKDQTVGNVFAKQLMQVQGLGKLNVQNVLNNFPTLTSLMDYIESTKSSGENVKRTLSSKLGKGGKCIDNLVDLLTKENSYFE